MKIVERTVSRRFILAGAAAAALAWAARPVVRPLQAQTAPAIVAVKVAKAPTDPDDSLWGQAQKAHVPLNPQNIVVPRLVEAGAKGLDVRALYDADTLALLLEWPDAHRDVDLGTVLQYRDAVAVQFPEDPSLPTPSFTMGQKGQAVVIYHWKSDWQFGRLYDVDEAYPNMYADLYQFSGVEPGEMPEAKDYLTRGRKEYLTAAAAGNALADPQIQEKIGPVQKMRAEGFGTIEPNPAQDAQGKGSWRTGTWRIAISMPRKQAKFTFEEGSTVPLAFAAWDGSRSERNGQKAYSIWNPMSMGAPAPAAAAPGVGVLVPLASSIAGVTIGAFALLLGFRLWRSRQKREG